MRARWALVWLAMGAASAMAQLAEMTQWQFHGRVVGVYNFQPHLVSPAQQKSKGAEMDAFWKDVKADTATMLPMLRVELKDPSAPKFFRQDGSALLLSMSHSPEDEQLAADSLAKTDLADTTPANYFKLVQRLATDGADVKEAALHILDQPGFKISAGGTTLNAGMSMVFLLLPSPESKWADSLVEEFNKAKKDETKTTLLTTMFFAQMPQTDAVIMSAAQSGQSAAVQSEAQRWIGTTNNARKAKYKVKGSEAEIRTMRSKRATEVSDASLSDISMLTGRLVQLRKK